MRVKLKNRPAIWLKLNFENTNYSPMRKMSAIDGGVVMQRRHQMMRPYSAQILRHHFEPCKRQPGAFSILATNAIC